MPTFDDASTGFDSSATGFDQAGSGVITPAVVSAVATVPTIGVPATPQPDTVNAVTTVGAPNITLVAGVSTVAAAATVNAPSINVIVGADVVSAVATVGATTITDYVPAVVVQATATVGAPGIPATVTPDTVAAAATVGSPGIPATVIPAVVAATATVGAPDITLVAGVSTVQATATVGAPTVIVIVVAVTVAATATVADPTVPTIVNPSAVAAAASVPGPLIIEVLTTSADIFTGPLTGTMAVDDPRDTWSAVVLSPTDSALVSVGGLTVYAELLSANLADGNVQVELSDDPTFATLTDSGVSGVISDGDTTTVPLTGLVAGTTYYVRARGGDATTDTWGAWSATFTVTAASTVGEGYAYLYADDIDSSVPVPQLWWVDYAGTGTQVTVVAAGLGATQGTYSTTVEAVYNGGTETPTVVSWTQHEDTNAGAARAITYGVDGTPQYQVIVLELAAVPDDGGVGVVFTLDNGTQVSFAGYTYPPGETMSNPGSGWWVEIRNFYDPTEVWAQLLNFQQLSFTKPLNDVGTGTVTFSKQDPIVDILLPTDDEPEGKALLTFPSYWSFMYEGAERFRMVYEGKQKDILSAEEPENITITGSGRGIELSWAVVLPRNWPSNNKAWPRKQQDTVWAVPFLRYFDEALARGEIRNITPTFTETHDSYGMPWTILGDRETEVGTNLLDMLQTMADTEEFDWLVTQRGRLHAAPELGQDLSYDIRFLGAVNVNETGAYEDRRDVRNRIYVEGTAGRVSVVDGDVSQARWGVRAMYLRSEEASSERQRLRVARGTLRQTKRPARERTVKVPFIQVDETGAVIPGRSVFVDYGLGDIVGLGPKIDNITGDPKPSRDVKVREISISVADGQTDLELTFESRAERTLERAKRLLQQRFGAWSSSKTARQGKPPVANLRDTDAEFPNPGETLVYDDQTELWKNGRPTDVWPFWFNGPLSAVVSKMYFTVDANRIIRRVTGRLGDPGSTDTVLRFKRNDITIYEMTIPAGRKRQRDIVYIPVTPEDDLSLDVVTAGTGSGYLQFIAEAG